MKSATALRVAAVAALLSPLGCASKPPEMAKGVELVSQNGSALYYQAKTQYAAVLATGVEGEAMRSQVESVVLRSLDGAIANDGRCPLFYSAKAQVHLDLGEVDQAHHNYEKARRITQDWLPAWLGLAEVATRRGDLKSAENYLKNANTAMNTVFAGGHKHQPSFFEYLGLNVQQPKTADPNDPTLAQGQRMMLLMNWMREAVSWNIANPTMHQPQLKGSASPAGLQRRMRARLVYQRVRIDLAKGQSPKVVIAGLDEALRWDPDYYEVKFEKARQLRVVGHPRQAERLLKPYLDGGDPKLAHSQPLLFTLASIYTDWYEETKEPAMADLADDLFTRLHKINPKHTEGYLERAELYLAAGVNLKRPDTLDAALTAVANARKDGDADADRLRLLEKKIQDAKQALASP